MVPRILDLGHTVINWPGFIKGAAAALGYDPSQLEGQRPLKEHAKFLAIARKFKDQTASNGLYNLRTAKSELRHLHFAFIVACDREALFELMQCTRLAVSANETITRDCVAIVSGTLDIWYDAIVELNENNSADVRFLIDLVYATFDRLGLAEIWHDYMKKPLPDQTFLLEHK